MSEREMPEAWLHIYGQFTYHGEARIRGTAAALVALRDAIDAALQTGRSESSEMFAGDGEGYTVEVERVSTIGSLGYPEYICEIEWRAEQQVNHRERIRNRKLRERRSPFERPVSAPND